MREKADKLRKQIRVTESDLYSFKKDLEEIEKRCGHREWEQPRRLAERIYDGEVNVRWVRICKGCGLVQTTTKVREKTVEEPVFSEKGLS